MVMHVCLRERQTRKEIVRGTTNAPKALPSSLIIIDQRFTQGVSSLGVISSLRTVELSKSYCSSTVYSVENAVSAVFDLGNNLMNESRFQDEIRSLPLVAKSLKNDRKPSQ